MLRILLFFVAIALIAWGLSWLADRPGEIIVRWESLEVVTTVFHTVLALVGLISVTILFWSLFGQLISSPGRIMDMMRRRKQSKGLDALSTGIIAVGAGDRELAARYAQQARRALPHEPLTDLLRAQAAQLAGDKVTAHRIFEAMLGAPDTEMLGLRGLFLEAREENAPTAARQFAERALEINPKIDWPVNALFELQCKDRDWDAALETLALAKRYGHIDKKVADRRRAVLLAGQAQELEDSDMDSALAKATEAQKLAPDLVPAAAVAGRILAGKGQTRKLSKVITQTWRKSPHPDLARVYAYARPGDSPRDRVTRVKELAAMKPHDLESPIAIAKACIEARDFAGARFALKRTVEKNLTQRVCALMAQIEGGEHGDRGRVREWLARAVTANRDPAWTADGQVSQEWAPVSPVTGRLDAYEWKVPVEAAGDKEALANSLGMPELTALAQATDTLAVNAADANDAAIAAARLEQSAVSAAPAQPEPQPEMKDVTPPTAPPENAPVKTSVEAAVEPATQTSNEAADAAPTPVPKSASKSAPRSAPPSASETSSRSASNTASKPAPDSTSKPSTTDNAPAGDANTQSDSAAATAQAAEDQDNESQDAKPASAADAGATQTTSGDDAERGKPSTPAAIGGTGSNGTIAQTHKSGKPSRSKRREKRAASVSDRAHAPDDPGSSAREDAKAPS